MLHILGIIQIVTPICSVWLEEPIPPITKVLAAKDVPAKAHIPIQIYQNDGVSLH